MGGYIEHTIPTRPHWSDETHHYSGLHYDEITWALRWSKALATRPFVQQIVQANIHGRLVDSPDRVPVTWAIREKLPYHDVFTCMTKCRNPFVHCLFVIYLSNWLSVYVWQLIIYATHFFNQATFHATNVDRYHVCSVQSMETKLPDSYSLITDPSLAAYGNTRPCCALINKQLGIYGRLTGKSHTLRLTFEIKRPRDRYRLDLDPTLSHRIEV